MSELHSLAALRQAADHLRAEERHWWADTIMAAAVQCGGCVFRGLEVETC